MARGFAVRTVILAAALSVLGACSVFEGTTVSCPTVGALDYAGSVTRFKSGGQRDLTDIEFQANVGRLEAECRLDGDTGVASIDLDILFRTQRGPASTAANHNFDYFVAVVDPDGGVAARKAFAIQVSFEGSRTEAAREESLALDIPMKGTRSLAAYRIYVGLELTREQFDRNLSGGR